MPWIRNGTVAVTNGTATVTGTNTSFQGSGAIAGHSFIGPDGRDYEILTVTSNTSLTLATNYLGTTASGASYQINTGPDALGQTVYQRVLDLISSLASTIAANTLFLGSPSNGATTGSVFAARGTQAVLESASGFVLRLSRATSSHSTWLQFEDALTGVWRFGQLGGSSDLRIDRSIGGGFYATALAVSSTNGALSGQNASFVSMTLSGGLSANSASVAANLSSASFSTTGNATIGGTLGVTGTATIATLAVPGTATIGGTLGVTGTATFGGSVAVGTNGTLLSSASVALGDALPTARWQIATGSSRLNFRQFTGTLYVDRSYIADGTGQYVQVSDRRAKKDIQPAPYGIAAVMQLAPVTFRFNEQDETADLSIGFIAQDVLAIVPEAVIEPQDDPEGLLGIDYSAIVPVLTAALKETVAELETLKARVAALESA
jgi:hypothetical protein